MQTTFFHNTRRTGKFSVRLLLFRDVLLEALSTGIPEMCVLHKTAFHIGYIAVYEEEKRRVTICRQEFSGLKILFDTVEKRILPIWNAEHRQNSVIVYMIW